MPRLRQLREDFIVLRQMLSGMPRGTDHAERLEAFYAPQAQRYDAFRDRLLPGRADLIARLPLPDNARVVEMGGGTGRNLDFFGDRLTRIESIEIVDLCPALLEHARRRARNRSNIRIIHTDATKYRPKAKVDCVYFSYALTMIPDWRAAICNAIDMLKPDGVLGVVDFYVANKRFCAGDVAHSLPERMFWQTWFGHDGVRLNVEHLPTLRRSLPKHETLESKAPVPYLPGIRVPYYLFIGRKA